MYFTCRVLLSKQIETATHYQIILVPKKRNFFLIKEREHSIRVMVIELCTHCRHPCHPHTILIAFLPFTFWLLHFLRSPSLPLLLVLFSWSTCLYYWGLRNFRYSIRSCSEYWSSSESLVFSRDLMLYFYVCLISHVERTLHR